MLICKKKKKKEKKIKRQLWSFNVYRGLFTVYSNGINTRKSQLVIFCPPQQAPSLPFPLFLSSFSSFANPSLISSSPFLPLIPCPPPTSRHPSCSLVSLCSLCYRCFSSRRLYCLVPVFYHGANKLQGRNHQVNAAPPEAISVRTSTPLQPPPPPLQS